MKISELLSEALSASATKMREIEKAAKEKLGISGNTYDDYLPFIGKYKEPFNFNKREINTYLRDASDCMGMLLFADVPETLLKRILTEVDNGSLGRGMYSVPETVCRAVLMHPNSNAELVSYAASRGRFAKRAALSDKRLTMDDLKKIALADDTRGDAKEHPKFSKIDFTDAERKELKIRDADAKATNDFAKSIKKDSVWHA